MVYMTFLSYLLLHFKINENSYPVFYYVNAYIVMLTVTVTTYKVHVLFRSQAFIIIQLLDLIFRIHIYHNISTIKSYALNALWKMNTIYILFSQRHKLITNFERSCLGVVFQEDYLQYT